MIGKCEYCGTLFGHDEKRCDGCGAPLPLTAWAATPQYARCYPPPQTRSPYDNYNITYPTYSSGSTAYTHYPGTYEAGRSGLVSWTV